MPDRRPPIEKQLLVGQPFGLQAIDVACKVFPGRRGHGPRTIERGPVANQDERLEREPPIRSPTKLTLSR